MIRTAIQALCQSAMAPQRAVRMRRALAAGALLAVLAGCAAPPGGPSPAEGPAAVPALPGPASSGTTGAAAPPALERPRRRGTAVAGAAPATPAPVVETLPAPPVPPVEPDSAPAEEATAPTPDGVLLGRGVASWYGPQFHGRRTASGERFDRNEYTAAHRTLPFGARVCVRSAITGKAVVVRINDRGPFSPGRVIDLSQAAAEELGMLGLGLKPVELWQLASDEDHCPEGVEEVPDDEAAQPPRGAEPAATKPKARGKTKVAPRQRRR